MINSLIIGEFMIESAGGMIPFLCHLFLILFGGFFGLNFAFNKNFAQKNFGFVIYLKKSVRTKFLYQKLPKRSVNRDIIKSCTQLDFV